LTGKAAHAYSARRWAIRALFPEDDGGTAMKLPLFIVSLALGGGLLAAPPARAQEKSLYERLGGEPALTAVVDDFTSRAAGNAKVNFLRTGKYAAMDIPKFKKHLVNLIASVTGGPQKYSGRDMKTTHKGMGISDPEFDAIAEDLAASLDKFKVPAKEKGELLKIVASTRSDIVEVKPTKQTTATKKKPRPKPRARPRAKRKS
jgi:hemoglobin